VLHWGHVQVDEYDVKLHVDDQGAHRDRELTGWDDPRAPTIQSMRRRGIQGQALVDSMTALGMSTSDVDLAMSSVYANNRDLVDDDGEPVLLRARPRRRPPPWNSRSSTATRRVRP